MLRSHWRWHSQPITHKCQRIWFEKLWNLDPLWVSWKASKTKWIGIPYKSHSQRGHTKRWARHTAKKSKELFHVEHCTVYSFVFLVLRFARLDTMQKKSWSMLITVQCTILFSCFLSRCLSIRLRVFQKKPHHKRNNSFHRHILGIVG